MKKKLQGKTIAVYSNKKERGRFNVGAFLSVNTCEYVIDSFDRNGYYEGIFVALICDVWLIELKSDYIDKINMLRKRRKKKRGVMT